MHTALDLFISACFCGYLNDPGVSKTSNRTWGLTMVLKNSRKNARCGRGARERKRKGERDLLWGSSWLCLSALAHQMRSASALECVCESSLTTDPPNHYHRNLIQTIHSASFIVCACVLLSIILLPLSTFFRSFSPKNMCLNLFFKMLFPQSSPFFDHWLLNVFMQTDALQAQVRTHTWALMLIAF